MYVLSREEESVVIVLLPGCRSGLWREVWEAVGVSAEGGITGMHCSLLREHS